MRISDQEPSSELPEANSDDVKSSAKSRKDEPSAFSRTLAKKRDSHPPDGPAKLGRADQAGGIVPEGQNQAQNRFDSSLSAERVGSTPVEVPPELQQLVREISVVVNAPGNQQVHIELNSQVLKGLHIRIDRQNGAIAIQFQSASAEVSRLLSTNLNSLAQGLADRGVHVSDIRVKQPQSVASAAKYKQGSNLERRWQGGRQGQRG
jgi:flagellar hook-length control protein FliK